MNNFDIEKFKLTLKKAINESLDNAGLIPVETNTWKWNKNLKKVHLKSGTTMRGLDVDRDYFIDIDSAVIARYHIKIESTNIEDFESQTHTLKCIFCEDLLKNTKSSNCIYYIVEGSEDMGMFKLNVGYYMENPPYLYINYSDINSIDAKSLILVFDDRNRVIIIGQDGTGVIPIS